MNHEYFMGIALEEARNALDKKEFPVGCIIIYRDSLIARGSRSGSSGKTPNETDHAEINALRHLSKTLHPGIKRADLTLYCTLEPCLMCFSAILLSGIRQIVYAYEDVMGGGTGVDRSTLTPLYRDMEVDTIPHVLRKESLDLFKTFFSDENNIYWKDSLLARYTLSQQ